MRIKEICFYRVITPSRTQCWFLAGFVHALMEKCWLRFTMNISVPNPHVKASNGWPLINHRLFGAKLRSLSHHGESSDGTLMVFLWDFVKDYPYRIRCQSCTENPTEKVKHAR